MTSIIIFPSLILKKTALTGAEWYTDRYFRITVIVLSEKALVYVARSSGNRGLEEWDGDIVIGWG